MISSSLSIPRFEFPAIRLWAILGGLLSVSVFGLGTVQASDAATQRAHKQQREEMARSIRAERERRLAMRPAPASVAAPASAPSSSPAPLAAPAQPLAAEFTARSVPANPGQAKAQGMNADERRQMREQLRQQNQQRRADHQESFAP